MKKITGMFWHCHHDILCEWVYDYQERADYIKTKKPENEIETRLRLFKKIKGKLPKEYVEAWEKYVEAWKKYVEAGKKYFKAWKKFKPEIEALHKKECGCKEWNGETLIFEEKGK